MGSTTIVPSKQSVRVPTNVMNWYHLAKGDKLQWWTEDSDIPDLEPNFKEGEVIVLRIVKANAKQVSVSD